MLNLSDIGSVPDYFSGRNVITGNAALLPLSPVGCDDPIASGADRKSTAAIVDATQFGQGIAGIQTPDFEPARFAASCNKDGSFSRNLNDFSHHRHHSVRIPGV
ncbi:MAG: hypothetical protein WA354_02880 [Terracidiphilus sp.]